MLNRRDFVKASVLTTAAVSGLSSWAQDKTKSLATEKLEIVLPRGRVPVSFIIDDSTCLVNMGRFCMPQFASAWPDRDEYKKPWRDWPAEIPDSFVREFGTWCAEHDVRGKYSIVPYPACVGWLDRELPGWSRTQLQESLRLVRELMVPRWDVHPEMITHTRVIDLKTGRPHNEISPATMENSFPQQDISVDELTAYLAYALQILKNCDLPCEGITTPGGFGNKVKAKLPVAVFEAVRDIYGAELPHYFKYVSLGEESVLPKFEHVQRSTDSLSLTVNVPAGTGDWFGGWDGVVESQGEKYCNADASAGRMVELLDRRDPAIMLCHWPGLYCNGTLAGFHDFQKIVVALESRYKDQMLWMKPSEIGRYWTAKEYTKLELRDRTIHLSAPFSCPNFTVRASLPKFEQLVLKVENSSVDLKSVSTIASLQSNTYLRKDNEVTLCFDLPKGESEARLIQS